MSDSTASSLPVLAAIVEQDSPQIRSVKTALGSRADFEEELLKLREDNRSLQLRVLGVNELARLLQDRIEVIQVLQDKNKRLEVAVVRLENRCSNFERKLKSQGGAIGPKAGQSPFIPGPSRQILEALMKENSELKKTLNKVSKRGASGYLEAVKISQLEEVIDSQKQEVDFLKNQIQSLTSSTYGEEEAPREGERSLPAMGGSVDTGPLKRQLIKMQHALKVKDRFCTLLSQQVADFQQQLNAQRDAVDAGSEDRSGTSLESDGGEATQEHTPHDSDPHSRLRDPPSEDRKPSEPDHRKQLAELEARYRRLVAEQKDSLEKEREGRVALTMALSRKEEEMKMKTSQVESLENKCDDLTAYNHTLLDEKTSLAKMLAEAESRVAGGSEATHARQMEEDISRLRQQLEERDGEHSTEVEKKDKEINHLRMMLEDSHYQLAIAESKLASLANEKAQEIESLKTKVEDLEIELSAEKAYSLEVSELKRNLEVQMGHYRVAAGRAPSSYVSQLRVSQTSQLHCRPTPDLILPDSYRRDLTVVDSGAGAKSKSAPQYPPQGDMGLSSRTIPHMYGLDRRCGPGAIDTVHQHSLLCRGDPTSMEKPQTLNLTSPLQTAHARLSTSPTPTASTVYGPPHPHFNTSGSTYRQPLPPTNPATPMAPYQPGHPASYSMSPTHNRTLPSQPRTNYTTPVTIGYTRGPAPMYRIPGQHPGNYTSVVHPPGHSVPTSYSSSTVPLGHPIGPYQPVSMGQQPFMSTDSTWESGISSMGSYQSGSLGGAGQTHGGKLYEGRSSSPHEHAHYPPQNL